MDQISLGQWFLAIVVALVFSGIGQTIAGQFTENRVTHFIVGCLVSFPFVYMVMQ